MEKPKPFFANQNLATVVVLATLGADGKINIIDAGAPLLTSGVVASDGVVLPVESLAKTASYNTDGTLDYVQVVFCGATYRQSQIWSAGLWAGETEWVKQ